MKKTLLLSVVASTMIMAGGDIAPVEPVVEVATPAPVAAVSGWDFAGQGVVYYQTNSDMKGSPIGIDLTPGVVDNMFDKYNSAANAGVSLSAVNKDIYGGLGAGVKLVGLGTLDLQTGKAGVVDGIIQGAKDPVTGLNGGAITELYLTYGVGNTMAKVGRQTLPKALSPLAFSENVLVFENTYEAALLVNSDIPNTTLVGAWVKSANGHYHLNDFNKVNGSDGVFMVTAANKSVEGLALTGTVYYAPDFGSNVLGVANGDDLWAGWLDAGFDVSNYNIGLQAGTIMSDDFADDTVAFGGKVGGKFDNGMNFGLAVTDVNDGGVGVFNVVDGHYAVNTLPVLNNQQNALYTNNMLGTNTNMIALDSTSVLAKVGMDALGGHFCAFGDYSDLGDSSLAGASGEFYEAGLVYNTTVFNSLDLMAGYVYQNIDLDGIDEENDDNNLLRVVARYNF